MSTGHDPIDLAVDRACDALNKLARMAEERGALALMYAARSANRNLLDTWEDDE